MQDGRKAVWNIPYVSVASFFPSLKQNFIAYRSSKLSSRPDCIFEIHQLLQSGFSRGYSNSCCRSSFEPGKIGQSSHKMYSNKIVNFQESTTILNSCTKKVWKLIEHSTYIRICICMNRASIFEWHKRFKDRRESVRDDERCGRSKEINTPELTGQIKNFMDKNRHVSIDTISAQFHVRVGTRTHNCSRGIENAEDLREVCPKGAQKRSERKTLS